MQVSTANEVKIYNISTGKSLPEWITERKRRKLLQTDEDLRRSIELIQDFEMPTAATSITMTPDNQYILATGTYKPRVRCYETSQLSMKFERCINSEVVAMTTLSDDYSKFVMLLSDRNLEFHVQHGSYYHTRIPIFGRDLAYHYPSCDLYVASASSDIYRLNLEQGRYMTPLATKSSGSNVCVLCEDHQLLAVGTEEGLVECFDPRSNTCVGVLDVSTQQQQGESSSITALQFRDGLTLGVGTSNGQVLLYDIRSPRPQQQKDHYYQLPIVSLHFNKEQNLVLSADKMALRIWDSLTGSPYTTVEPGHNINSVCPVSGSGLIFFALEDSKMQSYYIPSIGPAPKWCSFLDNLTEELEETPQSSTVYDDYKFVTKEDLDSLGLSHLIGTNTLKAYMHGYFMDTRLFYKAKSITEPFAYEEYRRNKIKTKIQQQSINRAKTKSLPKINKELIKKLQHNNKEKSSNDLLTDNRFSALFLNPEYEIDPNSEEYRHRNRTIGKQLEPTNNEMGVADMGVASDTNDSDDEEEEVGVVTDIPSITIQEGDHRRPDSMSQSRMSLGRLIDMLPSEEGVVKERSLGSQETTFKLKKSSSKKHDNTSNTISSRHDRQDVRRTAATILPKKRKGPVYWRGKRVK